MAALALVLVACAPRPSPVYKGPEKVTAETYLIADSVSANCDVATRIIVRDNAIHREQTRGMDRAKYEELWSDILPGGEIYAHVTQGVTTDDLMVEDLAHAPMREYAISRLHRERGDQVAEAQTLVLAILPQESFKEWRANAAGAFHLRNEGSYGVYAPAACRLATVCRLPKSKQTHVASQCRPEW